MTTFDIRQRVRERLAGQSGVRFQEGPDWIKIQPADPSGFDVAVYTTPAGFTIAFDGWHEELTSERDALDCVVFGLSQSCRLAVALRGTYPTTWTVEALEDDIWTPLSVTGLLLQPFWRRVQIDYRANRIFDVLGPEEVAKFRRIATRAYPSPGEPRIVASILWRRLDTPGHDASALVQLATGWRIDGAAVFRHAGAPARLHYQVECDRAWIARHGRVIGAIGGRTIDLVITREHDGAWVLNGTAVPGLSAGIDLDLGFTPATNLLPLRRLALKPGESADAPAAWLDVDTGSIVLLHQRYEKRTATTYWYESPQGQYADLLDVTSDGFVRRYPGLWEAEPS